MSAGEPTRIADADAEVGEGHRDAGAEEMDPLAEFGRQVPFWKLLSLATRGELLVLTLGCVAAAGHGVCQPLLNIIVGDLINAALPEALGSLGDDAGADDIIDEVAENILGQVNQVLLNLVIIAGCVMLLASVQGFVADWFVEQQSSRMRLLYFDLILHRDIEWLDSQNINELPSTMAAHLEEYSVGLGQNFMSCVQLVSCTVGCFVFAFLESWEISLMMSTSVPLQAVGAVVCGSAAPSLLSETQGAYQRAASIVEEVMFAIRTVVAFGGERRELRRFEEAAEKARQGGVRNRTRAGSFLGYMWLVHFLAMALGLWFGLELIQSGKDLRLGNIVAAFYCIIIAGFNLGQLPHLAAEATKSRRSLAMFFWMLGHDSIIQRRFPDDQPEVGQIETLELSDVFFAYPTRPDISILNGASLEIRRGQKVAVVGPSGSGKSTVMALLERFYDPSRGAILVNGRDLRSVSLRSYRKLIGYVGQEPLVFATSIRSNIMQGCSNATDADFEWATGVSQLDFVKALPEGFDTFMGAGGSQFSGGQKQRIAIARALVKKPSLLFLDEATSALDNISEEMIQQTIDSLVSGSQFDLAVVNIAHRLSTVRNSDVIFVLDQGVVVESGSHKDLAAKQGGHYQALVVAQEQAAADAAIMSEPLPAHESLPVRIVSRASTKRGSGKELQRVTSGKVGHQLSTASVESSQAWASMAMERRASTATMPVRRTMSTASIIVGSIGSALPAIPGEQDAGSPELKSYKPPLRRLFQFGKPETPLFVAGIISSMFNGACFPFLGGYVYTRAMTSFVNPDREEQRSEVEMACAVIVGVALAKYFMQTLSCYAFGVVGEAITKRIRVALLQKMLDMNIAFHDNPQHTPGRLCQALQFYALRVSHFCTTFGDKADMLACVAAGVGIAFASSWEMSLALIGIVPMIAITNALVTTAKVSTSQAENKRLSESAQLVSDSISNARTVHAAGSEEALLELYEKILTPMDVGHIKSQVLGGFAFGVASSILFWLSAASFWVLAFFISEERVTFERGMRTILSFFYAALGASMAGLLAADAGKAKVAASQLFELLDAESDISTLADDGTIIKDKADVGCIEFQDVTFFYPNRPDVQIMRGMSFVVESGTSVGLVGPSGSGKSTVLALLQRFYDPGSGAVLVGSQRAPLRDLNLRWWRRQIGYVGQEPILFDTTVLENVRYGIEDGEEIPKGRLEECKEMCKLSFLDDHTAQGWDTPVGLRGSRFSGGQKQRIAICRAMVRDPPILLLDEATSALDSQSEQVVGAALEKAQRGRTSFSVAHRLSTVQGCNTILVLEAGNIVERGSHEDLIAMKGVYFKLYELFSQK